MSILSTFALVTAAVVAKLRSNPDVEATKRIAELESQVENLQARLEVSLDDARRWQALAESWRARYETAVTIEQRSQQAAQQQYAAMQNQAMMNAQHNPYHQMLGQQDTLHQWERLCTCVPDRATALSRG